MDWLESLEVRWFFSPDHAVVEELRDWFADVDIEHDDRVDHYYFDPRRADLNAKDRTGGPKGNKLEFKYRVGTLGPTHLAPLVVGDLERWAKLSLKLGADTIASFPLSVGVNKARRLRKFVYENGASNEVAADQSLTAGCGVELTTIEATRSSQLEQAVTFGLEAFGPTEVVLDALRSTAHVLFRERPNLRLNAEDSASYSGFLVRRFPTP
ncbi:MAG: hypothetical protein ACOY0T_13320 [Myxococcota bacterium]